MIGVIQKESDGFEMKLTVSDKAHQWFKSELGLAEGDYLHFFGKYGGATNVHAGFSTAMRPESPEETPMAIVTKEGITYYTAENDDWFFSDYDLSVDYDETRDEPTYFYTE